MVSSRSYPRRRRLVLAAFLAALLAVPGAALARGEKSPTGRLAQLEREIRDTERSVRRLHKELMAVAGAASREEAEYQQLLTRVDAERLALDAARAAYEDAQRRLDQRVRTTYMEGPAAAFGAMFGSASLSDLALVLEVQDRAAHQDGRLADQTARLQRAAQKAERVVSGITSRQARLLVSLDERRQRLTDTFAEQQRLLTELTASRKELNRLLRESGGGPGGGPGQTGMTISFGEWAGHFLRHLGTPDCRNNRVAVVAWETAEYTQAQWNPLATTYGMPGATNFNSVGVKNYRSLQQGLDASVSTLLLGVTAYGYGDIIEALAECADPEVTAAAINASAWCHGCAGGLYVIQLIPAVESYFDSYASA